LIEFENRKEAPLAESKNVSPYKSSVNKSVSNSKVQSSLVKTPHEFSEMRSVEVQICDDMSEGGDKSRFNQSTEIEKFKLPLPPLRLPTVCNFDQENMHFFKLTLLSLQMNHKDFQIVKSIDANSLYAKANKVPFNQYHKFISKEL
jgi:hypothetical protein